MKKLRLFLFIFLSLFLISSCASKSISRVESSETIDLSGKWNDTDSRLVAEEMIQDVTKRAWLKKFFRNNNGKTPVLVVGKVSNRSDEHINTSTFVKNLEKSLINSGEVEFVANSQEREKVREERLDQASYSSEETAKREGQEIGADFMLQGSINTITDKVEGKSVKYYQVNLELIEIETHKKVWIGEKQIKKFVKQSRFGF